jgi:hypothetical protein
VESSGLYRSANAPVPPAGELKIQLVILISDFEEGPLRNSGPSGLEI